jgi:hypothetical protein
MSATDLFTVTPIKGHFFERRAGTFLTRRDTLAQPALTFRSEGVSFTQFFPAAYGSPPQFEGSRAEAAQIRSPLLSNVQ